jgi:hypothetical protein
MSHDPDTDAQGRLHLRRSHFVRPVNSDVKTQMRRTLPTVLVIAALLTGCNNAESVRTDEARAKLVGTWLTESEMGSVKSRRVLALRADGKFSDRLAVISSRGNPERQEYAGEWSYDGANFKRRYLQENGRQFSGGKIRYATFPLVLVSSSELVVDDNIQGGKVIYRRVAEGTQP